MTGARSRAKGRLADPAWYIEVYESVPVALLVMTPDLVMVEANHAYLASVGMAADDVIGRQVFEVFPNSPDRDGIDQVGPLYDVMRRAVGTGDTQVVVAMRYDIPDLTEGGFNTRWWNITEVPIRNDAGEVVYLLHFNDDITALVEQRDARDLATAANQQLQERVVTAQADLMRRALEMQHLNERLRVAGEHDRSVAAALQQAMLTELPESDQLDIVARYLTADHDDQVGGDWYDAAVLPSGDVVLVIGDVVGHDIHAAAAMGQLRSMMRAFTWADPHSPASVLSRLDHASRDLRVFGLATAVLAVVEASSGTSPAGRLVRWANAGHPPPILLDTDGSVRLLGQQRVELMLGIDPDTPRSDHEVLVPAGATLLLYTDGLIETRASDVDEGQRRLLDCVRRHHALATDAMIDAVLNELVGTDPADDVALLAVRIR